MLLVYSHAILWCIYAINRQIHTKFVWSTNPTLGHISGKPYFKDTCAPIFTAAVFITAKTWKQPKCPSTDRWIKRMWYIYTTKYYSIIKKDKILLYALIEWLSLAAQMVKHLSTMQETRVWSLGWEDPWRRKWQSTPVLLPGKSHGQRSLIGYSPWSCKESDTTERLHFHFHFQCYMQQHGWT